MEKRDGLLLALSAASMSVLLSAELHAPWSIPNIYSDVTGSFWGRQWVQAGQLPYLNSFFEYPVLSGLLLYVVRALGPTLNSFYTTFSVFSLAAALALAWSTWFVAKKLGRSLNPLFFLLPSFLIYGVYNFDLFHATFVMLSIAAYLAGRRWPSAVLLGLAVDMKLTSIVLLPVFILDLKTNRDRLYYLAAAAAAIALFNVPFAVANFTTFLQGYLFVGGYGLEDAWYVWIFQSPSTWTFAKMFGLVFGGLLLIRVYTLKVSFGARSALAVSAYLLSTYIYAPQFNILLIPLLAVLDLRHPGLYPWDTFNALVILTWFIPGSTPTLPPSWPQIFSLARAVCLAWMCLGIASGEGASPLRWLRRQTGGFGQDAQPGPPPLP